MDETHLAHLLSTIILPYFNPEAAGNLMLVNKQLYQAVAKHDVWKQFFNFYFRQRSLTLANTPTNDWLSVFAEAYLHTYHGLAAKHREVFWVIKSQNLPALRSLRLSRHHLMTIQDKQSKMLISTIANCTMSQAIQDYVFEDIIFPHYQSYQNYKKIDPYGYRLLHWAATLNQIDAINTLIATNNDLNLNARTQENHFNVVSGQTALHLATGHEHCDIMRQLLAAGADTSLVDHAGDSSLHFAARFGRLNAIQLLIDANANLNQRTNVRPFYTPIEVAVSEGQTQATTLFFANNVPLEQCAHAAAKHNALDVMAILIEAKISLDIIYIGRPFSPLYVAVGFEHLRMVKRLLRAGADVNLGDTRYNTSPLTLALHHKNAKIAHALIKAGAEIGNVTLPREWRKTKGPLVKMIVEKKLNHFIKEISANTTPHGLFSKVGYSTETKKNAAHTLINVINGGDPRLLKGHKTVIKLTPELHQAYKALKPLIK